MIRIEGLRHGLLDIPGLTLGRGRTALIGLNGAGKTTLLELLAGFEEPEEGSILIDGRPPREARIGWVGEHPDDTMLFSRVRDEVSSPLRFARRPAEEAERRAGEALASLGIPHLEGRLVSQLSGGEKALVAYAAALAGDPDLLLLDELDSHLDEACASVIHSSLLRAPCPAVLCTQDMDLAAEADHLVLLEGGRVACQGRPGEVFGGREGGCLYPPSWRMRP